jgi:hypothetical protein
MIEIYPNLFVGSQSDYENNVRWQPGWRIVQAAREPYHRDALGYKGRGAPKDHPEYLVAKRDDRLILNLIDSDRPAPVPRQIIDAVLTFIEGSLAAGNRVVVHCNEGRSRAPAIGLLYLAARTDMFADLNYSEAHARFEGLYLLCQPSPAIRAFLLTYWSAYRRSHDRRAAIDTEE